MIVVHVKCALASLAYFNLTSQAYVWVCVGEKENLHVCAGEKENLHVCVGEKEKLYSTLCLCVCVQTRNTFAAPNKESSEKKNSLRTFSFHS